MTRSVARSLFDGHGTDSRFLVARRARPVHLSGMPRALPDSSLPSMEEIGQRDDAPDCISLRSFAGDLHVMWFVST